jgi:hypothetical protein
MDLLNLSEAKDLNEGAIEKSRSAGIPKLWAEIPSSAC